MKTKIKKIVTPIFLSIICGAVCGRVEVAIDATTQTKRYMNVNHVGNIFM